MSDSGMFDFRFFTFRFIKSDLWKEGADGFTCLADQLQEGWIAVQDRLKGF
jgi:hypothetical protein